MDVDEPIESAHEFGALNTLLLVVVLGICILFSYLIKQNSIFYIPESAAAMMVGVVIGGLARLLSPSKEEMDFLSFEPEIFFFLLLPPIIFEAGYSLRKKSFFANFWTISLFAVGGTLVSTFIIGYSIYFCGIMGLVDIDKSSPMEALMFGALISAVDPVATLSIMGNPEINCDPLLYSLVFGESVLNDAVAIVLFNTFSSFYQAGTEFSAETGLMVLGWFAIISFGSVVVGVLTGLCCSFLCKHTEIRKYPEYEISILFLFAYGSYSFSEALSLSGIMSLFFCGIVLSHYNSYNLSPTSQVTAHNIFKSLAVLSEFFVFLYMGMGFFTGRFKGWNVGFSIIAITCCLLARAFNTFPFAFLANNFRSIAITGKMQVVIWFAGLRGAIAFALSLNMPGENRDLYTCTTLSVIIFTTVICGGLTEPMLNKMGMKVVDDGDGEELDGSNNSDAPLNKGLSKKDYAPGSMRTFWHKFDLKYMKPSFGGSSGDDDTEDTSLHFPSDSMLGGFSRVLQGEEPSAIELAVRPDWSETKRRYLGDATNRYDPPSSS
jgi:sodium/hydrogen exchanger 8